MEQQKQSVIFQLIIRPVFFAKGNHYQEVEESLPRTIKNLP